jgi:hypothetical protein
MLPEGTLGTFIPPRLAFPPPTTDIVTLFTERLELNPPPKGCVGGCSKTVPTRSTGAPHGLAMPANPVTVRERRSAMPGEGGNVVMSTIRNLSLVIGTPDQARFGNASHWKKDLSWCGGLGSRDFPAWRGESLGDRDCKGRFWFVLKIPLFPIDSWNVAVWAGMLGRGSNGINENLIW